MFAFLRRGAALWLLSITAACGGPATNAPDAAVTPIHAATGSCSLNGGPSALCSGTGSCPVRVDATLHCDGGLEEVSVAAGPGARGFVAATVVGSDGRHPYLATIDPTGGSGIEKEPIPVFTLGVDSDASGSPRLFGEEYVATPSGDTVVLRYGSPTASGWNSEDATPITENHDFVEGLLAADGTPCILSWDAPSDVLPRIHRRSAAGVWSSTALGESGVRPDAFVLDEAGHAHVGTAGPNMTLEIVTEDGASVPVTTIPVAAPSPLRDLAAPPPGTALPLVSTRIDGQPSVWIANASRSYAALDLPARPALPEVSCGAGPRMLGDPNPCQSLTTCTVRTAGYGVSRDGIAGNAGAALAATPDGGAWVAAVWNQVDEDLSLTPDTGPLETQCLQMVTADRGQVTLVLWLLSADGAHLDERWTGRIDTAYAGAQLVRLVLRGQRLLAIVQSESDLRYLELDTTQLH